MKANPRRTQMQPHIPRLAMEKYKLRASLEEDLYAKAKEIEKKRMDELNAYATAVDATMLLAIHHRYHFTAKILREIWEDMIRLRVQTRLWFRDGGEYKERETGKNIEDTAIVHDLMTIGVDIKAWEAEEVHVDERTGEVRFV